MFRGYPVRKCSTKERSANLWTDLLCSISSDSMTDPLRVKTLPASEAVPALRKMLKSGGFAYITVGDETRCLNFNPMLHGPLQRLPWPFSLIQPQGCSIEITAAS